MTAKLSLSALLAAGFALSSLSVPAAIADDRPPTAEERAAIEDVLRAEGFTYWEEIEFDDGMWEVDDARGMDGIEYDLKLEPETYRILKKQPD